ncbi:MAG: hypothetical protein ACJAV4_000947 [Pontimonas sp.]|jgi:hypothetical protein
MSYASPDTTEAPTDISATLGFADTCDSCGAQAYVRVTLESGELLFCGHHAAKHRETLGASILAWHDETDRLRSERSS